MSGTPSARPGTGWNPGGVTIDSQRACAEGEAILAAIDQARGGQS